MRRVFLPVALLGLLLAAAPLAGQEATPAGSATPGIALAGGVVVLPPDAEVGGVGLAEWSSRWWQWVLSFPPIVSPALDQTGDTRCGYGQAGPVFFLPPSFLQDPPREIDCTVPADAAVYVHLGGGECSTVEPPPFFGRDEAELRACAAAYVDPFSVGANVDGVAVEDVGHYRAASPMFTLLFPENNVLGVPAGAASAVHDGYALLLAPLPPGGHEVFVRGDLGDGSPVFLVTYRLTVVAPQTVEPAASPEAGASPAAAATPAG